MSVGRTTPRRDTGCCSELTAINLEPSMMREPFESTRVTRVETVVERFVWRDVVPCPSSCCCPPSCARFVRAPAALFGPNKESIEALAEDALFEEVTPCAAAEA